MGTDEIRENISRTLSSFADVISSVTEVNNSKPIVDYPDFIDDLIAFFPLDKVDWRTGIYDQYLFDLRKTVVDNFENGNYQVAYFYAHLIFMSFVYYCIEKAYQFQPNRMKDILYPLNAYRGKDRKKPSLENYKSVYDFSLFPEKDIFKVFYVIGMDDALIKNFDTYINSRDDFAHATGQGNISIDSLRQNIRTISGNMESLFQVFQPHMKTIYVKYLIEHSNHLYRTIIDTIDDFISDNQFSLKDIDFLCHLGMRVVQDEKQLSHEQYLMIRKVHCAFVEHCIDNYGIVPPANYTDLRNETFLYYKYANRAEEYVENELGISAYACAKDGGRFPVFECVNCGEEQLAYDEEHNKYHCFACGENYAGDALTFCSGCGSIMISNEVDLCDNCVAHKLED